MIQKADGFSIVFDTSGFISEIVEFNLDSDRESIDTSKLASTDETFIPACLSRAGEIGLELHLDPDKIPPWDLTNERVAIRFKTDAGFKEWFGLVYIKDYSLKGSIKDKILASMVLKITGSFTVDPVERVRFFNEVGDPAFNDDGLPAFAI